MMASGGPPDEPGAGKGPDEGGGDERDLYGEGDALPEGGGDDEQDPSELTFAGPPRKLLVIAGPDDGRKKRFAGVRMLVGRTAACHLHLSDKSVSRRHLELVQGEKGVLLRDLGSGNGTRVNGESVVERPIEHEDVIELGATQLQFIDETVQIQRMREAADRKEAEEKKKKEEEEAAANAEAEARAAKLAAGEGEGVDDEGGSAKGAAAAAATGTGLSGRWRALGPQRQLLVLLAGGVFLIGGTVLSTCGGGPELESPDVAPRARFASSKMADARVALMDGRLEEAVELIESAERIEPGIDVENLLEQARTELLAKTSLERVRSLMSEGRLVEAEAALDGIPTSSDALIAQRDALRAELSVRFHDAVEARALQAIDELDVEVARKLIPELPPERRAPLEKELARLEARVVSLEQQRAARQRQAAAAAKRSRARREQARIASVLRPIERKFEARSFDRAVLECDRVIDSNRGDRAVQARAQELKRLIPAFMRAWDDGNRKVQAHALESALAPLRRARELYGEIGFDGALGEQLDAQILESLLASARSAVARGDLGQAGALYREARKVDPSDRRPSAGLRQLSDRAEELYYEAYNDRHRDPRRAIAKMRLVMDLAEKGSPAWSKAKAQLAELQP